MSSQEEKCSRGPGMKFTEESKPSVQASVTASVVLNSFSKPLKPSQISPPSANSWPSSPRVAGHDHVINQDIDGDGDDDDNYFNNFPAGYRFCPHDHELILYYLKNKVRGQPLPRNRIVDVTLYQHHPESLAEQYKHCGEKELYIFTPRDRKYRNGTRPNRAAGGGYWKATGADKKIIYNMAIVGYRKALVYYTGKASKGDKTNWMMHEFRLNDETRPIRNERNDMRLDDWVLCKIYKKIEKPLKKEEQHSTDVPNDQGDCNSGTDSSENPRQQQATLLGGYADSALLCNSKSAALNPFLSEIYVDPVPTFPSSVYSEELQEESWSPTSLHFDLADTFNQDDLEAFSDLSHILPAVDPCINPSPCTNSAQVVCQPEQRLVSPKVPTFPNSYVVAFSKFSSARPFSKHLFRCADELSSFSN